MGRLRNLGSPVLKVGERPNGEGLFNRANFLVFTDGRYIAE